jgi:CheY-like chemotaxis protein
MGASTSSDTERLFPQERATLYAAGDDAQIVEPLEDLPAIGPFVPDEEVFMSITVVLAVGLDSWLLSAHSAAWRSAGYIVVPSASIREAIDHFKAGDFDLVLLGDSIPSQDKERLTFLIRSSGSRTPVISIADSSGLVDAFADATFSNDAGALLTGMGEILARESRIRAARTLTYSHAT